MRMQELHQRFYATLLLKHTFPSCSLARTLVKRVRNRPHRIWEIADEHPSRNGIAVDTACHRSVHTWSFLEALGASVMSVYRRFLCAWRWKLDVGLMRRSGSGDVHISTIRLTESRRSPLQKAEVLGCKKTVEARLEISSARQFEASELAQRLLLGMQGRSRRSGGGI